jgi:large subunit ribosomal protein L21
LGAQSRSQSFGHGQPWPNAAEKGQIMHAVIRTGGKQYYVAAGDILEVEKLEGEVGDTVTLDDVLLVADGEAVTIGQPVVEGASVSAKITGQYRGNKIQVFRYRPKKRIRVRRGHRQWLTRLQVEAVNV